ncbi:sensor histidine kinase [Streptomyces phaeochromogenes]|uniref:sensor histidine kinase n=1 Tax=Streptomyces phaeochromogenes TaxID=1923 RepID=UPI002DDC634B|nr:sensor histidine kinase [Streptomyces phaeochromogenes]WRZ34614.1 sensor histidine kinase [Streptomyces phaeochromogenes]
MALRQAWEWERRKAVGQHAFFTTVLTLTVLGALAGQDLTAVETLLRIGPALGLAAWYTYWIVLRGGRDRSPWPYLVGALAGWVVMTVVDPALLPVAVAVLTPYWLRRAWWSAGGVLVLGAAWSWQRFTTDGTDGSVDVRALTGCVLGIATAVTIACYVATLDHESHKRQLLLDELTATQAERAAAERQAGTLAERQRLAREVHDTLTQGFASIAMLLDAARDDLPPGSPVARRVEQAMRTARDNLAESRRLVHALRPAPLDRTHLADAVRELTARLTEETGIEAYTVVTGRPVALPPSTEGELLRVVQEALTNARRHAHAVSVSVTLSYLVDVLAIDIQDDGTGFAPAVRHTGIGLTSMRERVAALGGLLAVESAPGEGTTVAVTVPLPVEPSAPGPAPLSGMPGAERMAPAS